jgi:hypothetical protein
VFSGQLGTPKIRASELLTA